MDIEKLIEILESAPEPHRKFDGQIGAFFGWQRIEQDDQGRQVVWLSGSGKPARVPDFSTNVDDIANLATSISPGCAIAVTWGQPEGSTAKISPDGKTGVEGRGATPAMALCAATLRWRMKHPD